MIRDIPAHSSDTECAASRNRQRTSPLTQALFRCYQRIDKDKSRGNITADEQMRPRAKAEELYHEAKTQAGMPYEAFNESLASPQFISALRRMLEKQTRRTTKETGRMTS